MTFLRRSAGLATVLLSILGLLACLAGAAGVWAVRGRVDKLAAASCETADDAFDFMDTRLDRAKLALDRGRARTRPLADRVEGLTAPDVDLPAEIEPLRDAIEAACRELQSAGHWLDSSEAVARGVNRVAESVAAKRPDPPAARAVTAKEIAAFADDVADAIARLDALRLELIDIRQRRAVAREFVARTVVRIAQLDEKFAALAQRIDTFQSRVSSARASCANAGRRIQRWVAFAAIASSLVFLWFAASQVGMTLHGWRFTRKGSGRATSVPIASE